MRTKKVLLFSFFTVLFWAFLNQASAAPLEVVSPLSDFAVLNLPLDCNNTETTIATMKTEYAMGINHMKAYFLAIGAVTAQWNKALASSAGRTVRFPAGQFAALQASADNILVSSKKMSAWLEDFNDKFSVFSEGFAKCAKNKNKKVQIEDAFAQFFDMSSDSLGVTVSLFDYGSRQMRQWSAEWTPFEGQDVFIAVDQFEVVLNLSSQMYEAELLVQENADLALAELDIITDKGATNGRSSNHRAVQLFYR